MRSTSPTLREVRQRGRRRLDPQRHRLAQELEARVLLQRARQQVRLAQHLEAVADPDDRTAGARRARRRRASPARSARSRPCADSRRARTRRARRPRRRPSSCRRRATAARSRPPSCSSAYCTSSSQFVPGKQDDADTGTSRDDDLVRLDDRVREQPLAHLLDLRAVRCRHRARRRRAGSSCRCAPARRSCIRAPAAPARPSRPRDRRSRAGA